MLSRTGAQIDLLGRSVGRSVCMEVRVHYTK